MKSKKLEWSIENANIWDMNLPLWPSSNQSCRHLDLGILASRAVRKEISAVSVTSSVLLCYGSPAN